MNIQYDSARQEFYAEFQDFQGDLEACKLAKFHTTGPPDWRWYTQSVKALNRLRANKPQSGLTISPEALLIYTPLNDLEIKNEEVKARLKDARKAQKKQQKEAEKYQIPEGKPYITAEDLPPAPSFVSQNLVVDFPGEKILCQGCGDRLYFYDFPDICLWCSKQGACQDPFGLKINENTA